MPLQAGEPWPKEKISGVYLFSEGGRPIYVGRSRNIRQRYRAHLTLSHNSGSFAFLMARLNTGTLQASYKPDGSRQKLQEDPVFRSAFQSARDRIKSMDFQYVVEADPVTQCLLEVYCALALKTDKYNKFDTH